MTSCRELPQITTEHPDYIEAEGVRFFAQLRALMTREKQWKGAGSESCMFKGLKATTRMRSGKCGVCKVMADVQSVSQT